MYAIRRGAPAPLPLAGSEASEARSRGRGWGSTSTAPVVAAPHRNPPPQGEREERHAELPDKTHRAAHPDAVLRVDPDLLTAASAAGRSRAGHGRRGTRSRGHRANLREQYQLDQPLPVQYLYWVKGVLHGDLGESLRIKEPVRDADRAKTAGDAASWRSMAIIIALPDRHSGRHRLGGEEGHGVGLRRQYVRAVGHLDAEFLARHHADPAVLGRARLAAGLGLCAAHPRTGAPALPRPSCRPSCSATRSPRS